MKNIALLLILFSFGSLYAQESTSTKEKKFQRFENGELVEDKYYLEEDGKVIQGQDFEMPNMDKKMEDMQLRMSKKMDSMIHNMDKRMEEMLQKCNKMEKDMQQRMNNMKSPEEPKKESTEPKASSLKYS